MRTLHDISLTIYSQTISQGPRSCHSGFSPASICSLMLFPPICADLNLARTVRGPLSPAVNQPPFFRDQLTLWAEKGAQPAAGTCSFRAGPADAGCSRARAGPAAFSFWHGPVVFTIVSLPRSVAALQVGADFPRQADGSGAGYCGWPDSAATALCWDISRVCWVRPTQHLFTVSEK